MKIKSDFITNSSSASFILAVKKDTPREIIEKHLLENSGFKDFVYKYKDMFPYQFEHFESSDADYIAKNWAEQLLDNICSGKLDLGVWLVYGGECGNDDELDGWFLYENGIPDADFLKFRKVY